MANDPSTKGLATTTAGLGLILAGGMAAIVLAGVGAWVATGGLMSTEQRVATWCSEAVPKAAQFGGGRGEAGADLIEVCTRHYTDYGDESDHDKLACQAEAHSEGEWWACHGRSVPIAQADDDHSGGKHTTVEVAVDGVDRETAESAVLLGALAEAPGLHGDLAKAALDSATTLDMSGDIGGPMGSEGNIGSGGLGSRGSGLGASGGDLGGGTGESQSSGKGSGRSGYGSGGGTFGIKGSGGIGTVGTDPVITGALDKDLIDAVIKRHINQLRWCYQRELVKDPELSGKITVLFEIEADGSVSRAATQASTLGSSTVEVCVNGRFLRMKFPEPADGGTVTASYPFIFKPG